MERTLIPLNDGMHGSSACSSGMLPVSGSTDIYTRKILFDFRFFWINQNNEILIHRVVDIIYLMSYIDTNILFAQSLMRLNNMVKK